MLCGRREFIDRARRIRKRFGGGLRQAGVLAACGIISLTQMVDRLGEDHINAKILAGKILESEALEIDPDTVETNICIFRIPRGVSGTAFDFADAAENEGLLVTYMGRDLVRMVTHNDFRAEWIDAAVDRCIRAVERIA